MQNTAAGKAGESRGSSTFPLDNVFDYNGAVINTNAAGTGNAPYSANVTVTPAALNGVGDTSATSAALLITVAVTAGSETIQLQGYRTRHSPNLLP